jgi:hypothetical protein
MQDFFHRDNGLIVTSIEVCEQPIWQVLAVSAGGFFAAWL